MQQKELTELTKILNQNEFFIEVETNCTLVPTPEFDKNINQYNVSPKLSNSNNTLRLREKPDAFKFFSESVKSTFKFVIETPEDLEEVNELVDKYKIESSKVYLMPQGTTGNQLNKKQIWLVEICKDLGYNYTDRLHIHIYGDKKGV